ncbi:hypothetical protein B0H34DRAFT_472939 [Crassisporium funariophilum]|nr:hypothetical protein B0H34DRAFT_472939 [Crassisporium funariophilum]
MGHFCSLAGVNNIVIQLVAGIIYGLSRLPSTFSFLKHELFAKLRLLSASSQSIAAGEGCREQYRGMHVNVIGCAARVTSIVVHNDDTVADIVCWLVRSELCQLEPIVYFPHHRSGPLDYGAVLSSVGISDGSTVYTQWRLRGGMSRAAQDHEPETTLGDHRSHSAALQVTGKTGQFNGRKANYFIQVNPGEYICTVCPFSQRFKGKRRKRHEESASHLRTIQQHEKAANETQNVPQPSAAGPSRGPHLRSQDI